jgi:flavin-binding protein dodecin
VDEPRQPRRGPVAATVSVTAVGNADPRRKEQDMAVARVTEISSTSPKSFEDAIQQGVGRATKTLRNVRSAWVKEQRVDINDGRITEYQVNLMVTFILDD